MSRLAILLVLTTFVPARAEDGAVRESGPISVYVGTYTGGESRGIYLLDLDRDSGALTSRGLVAETPSPSFLALHPSGRFLYAVSEVGEFHGEKTGSVCAFAIDPKTRGLSLLNQQSSRGAGPCHLIVDRAGKTVLVANYGGGSVAALPIKADGGLEPSSAFVQHKGTSIDPQRQEGPHAHSINLDAANKFAVAADLGLDKLLVYRFDPAAGTLKPNDPPFASMPAGGGPRHFAFHPDGRHAFVILEITSQVVPLDYDAVRGTFKTGPVLSTLPEKTPGNSTAEVQVHPSGKFLYVSNRGHNSIAMFRIDTATGHLTAIGHQPTGGKVPRNFGIDPSGRFLLAANQDSGTVVVFRINAETGKLEPTTHSAKVPMPVCVKFH